MKMNYTTNKTDIVKKQQQSNFNVPIGTPNAQVNVNGALQRAVGQSMWVGDRK